MPDRHPLQPSAPEKSEARSGSGEGRPGGDSATRTPGSTQLGPNSTSGARELQRVQGGEPFDRWGDLPVQAREVFRNHGGSDFPPHYRDWIDQYYRRLNAKR